MSTVIDITLLRIMKYRAEYTKLHLSIPTTVMDDKTVMLLKDFGKYFKTFPAHDKLDLITFMPRFQQWHPTMDKDTFAAYTRILQQIIPDVDTDTRGGILGEVFELDLATKIANAAENHRVGELAVPLADLINSYVDSYKISVGVKLAAYIDGDDIESVLETEMDYSGVRWRLPCLNAHMRGLRPGDMGIVAARPDKGKTTFFTSEVSYMAPQLPEHKNVIWFNNESVGSRILPRLYQSALGCTLRDLAALRDAGKLRSAYSDVVGRPNRIRIHDVHGYNIGQIEAILDKSDPGIVIFDMLDHVKGFQGEARTDQQLEALYQWARERGVKYDTVIMASSQISTIGEGLAYPTQTMLKDSGTGKQGACDFITMIGAKNEPGFENLRYIGCPKNKLRREGTKSDPACAVAFNADIARYEAGDDIYEPPPSADATASVLDEVLNAK